MFQADSIVSARDGEIVVRCRRSRCKAVSKKIGQGGEAIDLCHSLMLLRHIGGCRIMRTRVGESQRGTRYDR